MATSIPNLSGLLIFSWWCLVFFLKLARIDVFYLHVLPLLTIAFLLFTQKDPIQHPLWWLGWWLSHIAVKYYRSELFPCSLSLVCMPCVPATLCSAHSCDTVATFSHHIYFSYVLITVAEPVLCKIEQTGCSRSEMTFWEENECEFHRRRCTVQLTCFP